MRKKLILIGALVLAFTLVSCGKKEEPKAEEVKGEVTQVQETVEEKVEEVAEEAVEEEPTEEAVEEEPTEEVVEEESPEEAETATIVSDAVDAVAKYKEEIEGILSQFSEITSEYAANPMDASVLTSLSEKAKPILAQLANVEAPDSLKDTQTKLVSGAQAYSDLFELQGNALSNPAAALENASKLMDLQSKLGLFAEALQEIYAAE